MKELELKYHCSEFFELYYSEGLFHPTECQLLYSHKNTFEKSDCLIVGEVYDDHDFQICYRKNEPEIWARSNYDSSFQKISENLKLFTEGWYQAESNHWGSMNSEMNLKNIIKFYQINDLRYNWESQPLIDLIQTLLKNRKNTNLFAKGHKRNLNLSSTNGFNGRPKTNMVTVHLDEKENLLKVYNQSNFFDYDAQSKNYRSNEIPELVDLIVNWIK